MRLVQRVSFRSRKLFWHRKIASVGGVHKDEVKGEGRHKHLRKEVSSLIPKRILYNGP